jgi:tetratricopeptide (TPR) repeat protein
VAAGAADLERAIALRPDYVAALDNLGLVHEHAGRFADALGWYARAAAVEPANPLLSLHLGNALAALGRHDDAFAAFAETIRLAPRNAAAYNGLGVALDHLGRTADAQTAFRAALEADPGLADAAANLGKLAVVVGDLAAAATWFERALAIDPRNGRTYLSYVNARSGAVPKPVLAAMERLAGELGTLPPVQQIELRFALAAACEDAGRIDDAFGHLAAGNALKRAMLSYDEAAQRRFVATLAAAFTPAFVAAMRGAGNPTTRPIFIVGMPRSGTTLVEQALAAIPSLAAGGELHALELSARASWPALFAGVPFAPIPTVDLRDRVRAIGDAYAGATAALGGEAHAFTDKLPHNFFLAPLIHLALPNARIIHVRRDPLDVCFSCYATLFEGDSVSYAYELGELARAYRTYAELMALWRALLPADRFIEVDYERLIGDFETEARELVAFCDLPWDAGALAFHAVQRSVRTASAAQVRCPLYTTAIGRAGRFAAHLGPLRAGLGDGTA